MNSCILDLLLKYGKPSMCIDDDIEVLESLVEECKAVFHNPIHIKINICFCLTGFVMFYCNTIFLTSVLLCLVDICLLCFNLLNTSTQTLFYMCVVLRGVWF